MKSFNLDTTVTVCGGTPQEPINVSNSDDSYVIDTLVDLELPNINVTDSDGTVTSVPSMEDITCTPPVALNISNSNDSYDVDTLVDLELPNINFTDSDGITTNVPSMENITATPSTPPTSIRVSNSDDSYDVTTLVDLELPNSTVSNSDDSYVQLVPATESLELPLENLTVEDANGVVAQTLTNSPYKDITINVLTNLVPAVDEMFKITINTAGSFTLPFHNAGTNVTVYWGDGLSDVITSYNQSELTHLYASAGVYQISVDGQFGGVKFNNGGSKLEAISIDNWGTSTSLYFLQSFYGCSNITGTYTDTPSSSVIPTTYAMFYGCTNFNQPLTLNLSNAIASNAMFYGCSSLNSPISLDVSKSLNMTQMFYGCSSLNSVMALDTSSSTSMNSMFFGSTNFNQDVSSFDTTNVSSMWAMFYQCTNFNQDVSGFNISSLTDASYMLNLTSFDTTNYDLLLISWAAQTHNNNVPFSAGTAKYSSGAAANAHEFLTNPVGTAGTGIYIGRNCSGWTITDGGAV